MRGLEEMNMLLKRIGDHFADRGDAEVARKFHAKAKKGAERARIIHDSVFRQEHYSEDLRFKL